MKNYIKQTSIAVILIAILSGCSGMIPRKGPQRQLTQVNNNNRTFDAIVVPGIPYDGQSWDSLMKARVLWAYALFKNGVTKNIIFSGDAVYSPYKESVVMGLYAEELGVPKDKIFFDTNARHSTENVYYSYLLAKKLGFKSIALATDPFQAFMLRGYSKKRFGTPVYHLPFIVDTIAAYTHLNPRIDATPAKVDNFVSITEQESFFKRFKGTMGKDINWKQYDNKQVEEL